MVLPQAVCDAVILSTIGTTLAGSWDAQMKGKGGVVLANVVRAAKSYRKSSRVCVYCVAVQKTRVMKHELCVVS